MKKYKRPLRPMNDIMLDLELCLQQLTDPKGHDMQWGEVRALVMEWLEVHAPHAQEEYTDNTLPVDLYGHLDHCENVIKKLVALRK